VVVVCLLGRWFSACGLHAFFGMSLLLTKPEHSETFKVFFMMLYLAHCLLLFVTATENRRFVMCIIRFSFLVQAF
jgi:hypothetical protein